MSTMRTALTAFSSLTNLSRTGHDFQHHLGTSMALQPQILGATGQSAVMRDEVLALDEQGVAVEIEAPSGTGKIPKDVRLPAFLIVLNCFINTGSYVIEFATFAIYFKQVHNWTDASLASMAQTAGDVMAAIAMQVIPVFFNTDYDPDNLGTCKRRLHYFFSKPYNLSFIILTWIIWNLGMMSPWLPVAIVAQVFMGTSFVYSSKWATEMNLYYSLGDSKLFLTFQVYCRTAESFGGVLGGLLGTGFLPWTRQHPSPFPLPWHVLSSCCILLGFAYVWALAMTLKWRKRSDRVAGESNA